MVHSLNAECFHPEGELAGATRQLMAAPSPPDKGVLMRVPIGVTIINGEKHTLSDRLASKANSLR